MFRFAVPVMIIWFVSRPPVALATNLVEEGMGPSSPKALLQSTHPADLIRIGMTRAQVDRLFPQNVGFPITTITKDGQIVTSFFYGRNGHAEVSVLYGPGQPGGVMLVERWPSGVRLIERQTK